MSEGNEKSARSRIAEALVIVALSSGVGAVVSSQVTNARMEERMTQLQREVDRQGQVLDRISDVIYRPSWEARLSQREPAREVQP